jgi:hypothetical protein
MKYLLILQLCTANYEFCAMGDTKTNSLFECKAKGREFVYTMNRQGKRPAFNCVVLNPSPK